MHLQSLEKLTAELLWNQVIRPAEIHTFNVNSLVGISFFGNKDSNQTNLCL